MAITFNNLYTYTTDCGLKAKNWVSKNVTPTNAKKVCLIAVKTLMCTVTETVKDAKWAAMKFKKYPIAAFKKITPIVCVAVGLLFGGFTGQASVVIGVGIALNRGFQEANKQKRKEEI